MRQIICTSHKINSLLQYELLRFFLVHCCRVANACINIRHTRQKQTTECNRRAFSTFIINELCRKEKLLMVFGSVHCLLFLLKNCNVRASQRFPSRFLCICCCALEFCKEGTNKLNCQNYYLLWFSSNFNAFSKFSKPPEIKPFCSSKLYSHRQI